MLALSTPSVIPIGLGLSLILNGIFLASKINKEGVLTLPDVFARRYGKTVEVLVSLTCITSFLMLLAGNLVGMGFVTAYTWGISQSSGIFISALLIWAYTVGGGLFAAAYTDVVQGAFGFTGCIVAAYWFIVNTPHNAAPPSVGFSGYVYPNDEICQMYAGIPCTNDASLCCYNATRWCDGNGTNCFTDVSEKDGFSIYLCATTHSSLSLSHSSNRTEPGPLAMYQFTATR